MKQAKSYESLLRKRARRQAKLVFKAMRREIVEPIAIGTPYLQGRGRGGYRDQQTWIDKAGQRRARLRASAAAQIALKRSK